MELLDFAKTDTAARLRAAAKRGALSHALIFSGSGDRVSAARYAAAAMECTAESKPCLACPACRKVMQDIHPDVTFVRDAEHKELSIDTVRAMRADAFIRPNEGRKKVYILPRGQDLGAPSQNALLKTIEEPPAYAVVMLLADNPDALLPTISSRCVQLNLKPVGDQLVKDYLMNEMHVPDYQAEVDASLAQGNIGKAERIARSPEYEETLENALRMAKYADSMPLYEIVETIKKLTAEKDNIDDYFDIFSLWFRDVLLFKATKEVDSLVFKQELNGIRERANKSSYEGLEKIIEAIQKARARLNANVNFDLTMELMFLTMKEN